jgi:hypothetical protein
LREEKELHQKENNEAQLRCAYYKNYIYHNYFLIVAKKNSRFNSLQQQFKILLTKHDDLEQQCTEAKKSLATENDELKRKLDHVQGQLIKTVTSKDDDIAMWKVKNII